MENEENINPTLPAQLGIDGARALDNINSSSNQVEEDHCESPTTSTSASKRRSITSACVAVCKTVDVCQSCQPSKSSPEEASGNSSSLDCPICLQACVHPARLPCGHIFCFLCIKGVAYKNQRCAMCRREIPAEFLDRPQLVNGIDEIFLTKCTDDGYQWFYEGRNGWWQYDIRTSQDIEDAYKKGEKSCTVLVAGYVYTVDLEAMVQQRQNEPIRCRRVKRDLATVPKKGVAGLRLDGNSITSGVDPRVNTVRSRQDRVIGNSMDDVANLPDLPHISSASIVPSGVSNDILTTNSSNESANLASVAMILSVLNEQHTTGSADLNSFAPLSETSNNYEIQEEENSFPSAIQINPRELEHRTDEGFNETLESLQQLNLRPSDALNPIQNALSERRSSKYRNNRC